MHTVLLETLYYKIKTEKVNEKSDKIMKPLWDAKLCLRDTLKDILDEKTREDLM